MNLRFEFNWKLELFKAMTGNCSESFRPFSENSLNLQIFVRKSFFQFQGKVIGLYIRIESNPTFSTFTVGYVDLPETQITLFLDTCFNFRVNVLPLSRFVYIVLQG